jgi:hypothetical protein
MLSAQALNSAVKLERRKNQRKRGEFIEGEQPRQN